MNAGSPQVPGVRPTEGLADRPADLSFRVTRDDCHFHPLPAMGGFGFYVSFVAKDGSPPAIYLYDSAVKQWQPTYALASLPVGHWFRLQDQLGRGLPVLVSLAADRKTLLAQWLGVRGEPVGPGQWDREMTPEAARQMSDALAQEHRSIMNILGNIR